jgi:hypothetical protein
MLRFATSRLIDDHRARRVAELLVVLWLLSLADLLFTLWAHRFTVFHELNPLARAMLHHDMIVELVLVKLGLTAAGTAIFWYLRHQRQAELAVWGLVSVYVMLAMRWSEYTAGAAMSFAAVQ